MSRWWGRKAAIKSIIAKATSAEKQQIYGDADLLKRLSRQLGRSEMLSLMSENTPLTLQLRVAMGGWRPDSSAIINLTAKATDLDKKQALEDGDLIARLDSKLRHHEMLMVLNHLKAPLVDKLLIMLRWDGYAPQVVRLIEKASDAQKQEITEHTAILSDVITSFREDYKHQVVRHLNLLAAQMFTNHPNNENVGFTSLMVLSEQKLTISKEVNFMPARTFEYDKEGFEALRSRFIGAVTTYLSNKFKLKIESPSGQDAPADGEYPIIVKLGHNPSANYRLFLYGGTHGHGGLTQLRGHIYEFGQKEENESSAPSVYLAHEGAHLLLGTNDEYEHEWLERVVYQDHSLMGNFYREGFQKAEIKARHFQFLVPLLSGWFPDRTISIMK